MNNWENQNPWVETPDCEPNTNTNMIISTIEQQIREKLLSAGENMKTQGFRFDELVDFVVKKITDLEEKVESLEEEVESLEEKVESLEEEVESLEEKVESLESEVEHLRASMEVTE